MFPYWRIIVLISSWRRNFYPQEALFPVTVTPARHSLPLHEAYQSKSPIIPTDTEVWLALAASGELTVDAGRLP
jgi:hypothetical protein